MITVKRLTLEDALVLLAAAEAKARESDVTETICVCDDGGHPIALHRMTGARITGVEIAIAKAFTAAGHRRATHKFNQPPTGPALPGNEAFGIHAMHPGRFAVFVGGFPIEVDGDVVGGIGISGGNGEQDTAVGTAALEAFHRHLRSTGAYARRDAAVRPRLRPTAWTVPVGLALVTAVVFAPVLRAGFVDWDDPINFLENPYYRGLGWAQLRWMLTATVMGHWIPVTWLTLGADFAVWGMNPFGYHLTNLLWHVVSAALFYLVSGRLLGLAIPAASAGTVSLGAAVAALYFAVHPLRVESVAWITERRDLTSGLFFLLTILAYLKAHERPAAGRTGWHWVSLGSAALALASKSIVMGLPLVCSSSISTRWGGSAPASVTGGAPGPGRSGTRRSRSRSSRSAPRPPRTWFSGARAT